LACELLTKNIVALSNLFVKGKHSFNSISTITENKKFQRALSAEEEFEILNKKFSNHLEDTIVHKLSKETYKLSDQRITSIKDLEEEENENLSMFFSFLNKEDCYPLNDTLCGYFQKVFFGLISQIPKDV